MRIAVDVSPLSHRRTGVGNYIRGSLAGLVDAGGPAHELVAFAPVGPAGKREIERAPDGLPLERQVPVLPAGSCKSIRRSLSEVGFVVE